jgi:hypothetical protein
MARVSRFNAKAHKDKIQEIMDKASQIPLLLFILNADCTDLTDSLSLAAQESVK